MKDSEDHEIVLIRPQELYKLLDGVMEVGLAMDKLFDTFNNFMDDGIVGNLKDYEDNPVTPDNVVDLGKRRIDKKQSDLWYPEEEE
jgi:hypothetical protein